jgi:acyl-CoA synthetase (AMP-forming)/AMP-acid ligase II
MVTAWVIPADGATVDEVDIIAFVRERLAGFETLKRVVEVDDLPTTMGGKILEYKLRGQLSAG